VEEAEWTDGVARPGSSGASASRRALRPGRET